MNNLELLHEGFKNEIDELESIVQQSDDYTLKAKRNKFNNQMNNIISNVNSLCDSLYREFEDSNESEIEELKEKNSIMLMILNDMLSDDDKLYIKLKYKLDVEKR